jgi:predicted ATPase
VTAKAVAQYAAVIGRQFPYDLLQVVSQLDESMLQYELGRLVEAEIVYQRGVPPQATYTFKHALIQDAAYASLLKSTRQQYHQCIAQMLEAQFPETAEAQPELLAHHFTEAGRTEKAVGYWQKAGQRASEHSAHAEAISHLRTGLTLLQALPETRERTQREVDMLIALGASLIATKGYAAPEVEQTYSRARQLCAHLDDPHQLVAVLRGLWQYYHVHADFGTAHALGEQLLALAQQAQDAALLVTAHAFLGLTLLTQGAIVTAHTHFTQGIALYDAQQDCAPVFLSEHSAGMMCYIFDARALWSLGYAEQGMIRTDEALTLAQQRAHPFSLSFALSLTAIFHQLRCEVCVVQDRAEATMRLAQEQDFPYWMAVGAIMRGWALTQQGQAQAGIEHIKQGMTYYSATRAELFGPYYLALLAEAYGTMEQPDAGLTALMEALTLVDTTGERWYESELYRLKGTLLLQHSSAHQADAETCFTQAIAIAQNQQAKSWELRAATSLARLWKQQGKRQEAYDLLAPVYGWFTEGFDTADLKDAKTLLDELSEVQL